jgi:hypothetical protein
VDTWVALLIPWGVAAIGGAGLYLRFSRQQSGRINTSEAAQLWEQSRAIQEATERRAVAEERRAIAAEKAKAECEERERLWLTEQRANERRHEH